MIRNLYQNIAAGLIKIRSEKVYMEDIPQNFSRPSFLISLYDQDHSRGINKRLKNTVYADISYFPEDETDSNEECLDVSQELQRKFQIDGFRLKNRNSKIVDKVLHYMFEVDYREFREEENSKMQTMKQNTDLKEV